MDGLYRYPVDSVACDVRKGGYAHNLNPEQQRSLAQLIDGVEELKIDVSELNKFALHPHLTALRYLRANQFDAEKALAHMQRNLVWRKEHEVNDIVSLNPDSILGVPIHQVTSVFPHWHSGYDKFGRPVLYKQYGNFNIPQLKALVGLDKLLRYHIWEQEQCVVLCEMQSHKRNILVETTVAVLDIDNMRLSQITSEFVSFVKALAEVDSSQYVETLGAIFIINAPSAFPFVWRMFKPFLDPNVAAKISIFSSPRDWQPVLFELIGKENMPLTYGGLKDALSPDRHPYEESMLVLGLDRAPVSVSPKNSSGIGNASGFSDEEDEAETKIDNPINGAHTGHVVRYRNLKGDILMDIMPDDPASNGEGQEVADDGNIYLDAFDSESKIRQNQIDPSHVISEDGSDNRSDSNSSQKVAGYDCTRYIEHLSTQKLNRILVVFMCVYTLLALITMGFSGYLISSNAWISEYAKVQLWTGAVMLLTSVAIIFSNLIGLMAIYYSNRLLMKIFNACNFLGLLVFLIVGIACFLYAFVPQFAGWGNIIIDQTFNSPEDVAKAKRIIIKSQIALGSSCFVAAVLSVGPIVLSSLLYRRLLRFQGAVVATPQIRYALRIAQYIALITAGIMLTYGSTSLRYLMNVKASAAMFPVYGLIYGGISLLLLSLYGIWASFTKDLGVLKLYKFYLLPLLITLLFSSACVSFGVIPNSGAGGNYFAADKKSIQLKVETQLLVVGVLSGFASVFQIVSFYSACLLITAVTTENEKRSRMSPNSLSPQSADTLADLMTPPSDIRRSWVEKAIIVWSTFYGLFSIYFYGTFVIFSAFMSKNSASRQNWVSFAWFLLGKLDKRFISNDGYVVASSAILSLVVGPLLLGYAWSLFLRLRQRQAVGIVASVFLLYTCVLYYAIEIHIRFADFSRKYSGAVVAMFLFSSISSIVIPGFVLYRESCNTGAPSRYFDVFDVSQEESSRLLDSGDDSNAENASSAPASLASKVSRIFFRRKPSNGINSLPSDNVKHSLRNDSYDEDGDNDDLELQLGRNASPPHSPNIRIPRNSRSRNRYENDEGEVQLRVLTRPNFKPYVSPPPLYIPRSVLSRQLSPSTISFSDNAAPSSSRAIGSGHSMKIAADDIL